MSFANVSLDRKPRFVPVLNESADLTSYSSGTQNISDKTVADCVEALLGAALMVSCTKGILLLMTS